MKYWSWFKFKNTCTVLVHYEAIFTSRPISIQNIVRLPETFFPPISCECAHHVFCLQTLFLRINSPFCDIAKPFCDIGKYDAIMNHMTHYHFKLQIQTVSEDLELFL